MSRIRTARPRWARPLAVVAITAASALVITASPGNAADGTRPEPAPPAQITAEDRAALASETMSSFVAKFAESWQALGIYVDPATSQFVIRVPASGPGSRLGGADLAVAGLSNVRVQKSTHTRQSVDALSDQLKQRAWHPDAGRYEYGFYYDARRDVTVVNTDAPAEVTRPIQDDSGGALVVEQAPTGRDSRWNDGPPHWGGASITNGSSTCSSGFSVQNSSGTRFMVTAAHCFGLGAAVHSSGGGGSFGTVVSRGPFPTWDLELLGGASYGSHIYTGGSTGVGTHVIGAGDPVINFTGYCRSGQTTFEQCGQTVTSLSGTFCDSAGCTPGLIVYSGGGTSAGGDSGAPFYLPGSNGVFIRGVHIARSGSTMYAEKWSTVAGHFGVSIVT